MVSKREAWQQPIHSCWQWLTEPITKRENRMRCVSYCHYLWRPGRATLQSLPITLTQRSSIANNFDSHCHAPRLRCKLAFQACPLSLFLISDTRLAILDDGPTGDKQLPKLLCLYFPSSVMRDLNIRLAFLSMELATVSGVMKRERVLRTFKLQYVANIVSPFESANIRHR